MNTNLKRVHSITIENNSKYTKIQSNIDIYNYFLHKRTFSNIKIILKQDVIWCDKALLSAASSIFREDLLKLTKDDSLIYNDINLNDFLSLLEFIYPIFNPEINENNISCLIELSYRFQFDILKQACQIYIIKYLNRIRRVFTNNYHHLEAEGDCFVNSKYEHRKRDLIEFHNQTCVDAFDIIVNLCRWLKTYYNHKDILTIQAIISILKQISIDNLEQAMITVNINDEIKAFIYKERAQYVEQIYHNKHVI